MRLAAGTRIGTYEIVAPLGAGGMGEVYRALDTRLERTVAIKSLPPAFASDPERLARFDREAKLLASLNHPNIATIYGLEGHGSGAHLVLEFVEGESLAQRLARGPLSVRETLECGAQIAAAIEAAHERGIVHRDLKPANVMLTPSGTVKVLDFGLAKGGEGAPSSVGARPDLPTMSLPGTADGLILGTAPYMSPEQARGLAVDRRTDVWSFGCLLYECLSDRQPFSGETVSDVVARILEREPDWDALPSAVPGRLRDLVRRCLTKDVADRPRDIGDLRRELIAIGQDLSAPGRAAPVAEKPSLAVLYFENLTQDPESDYFCAGITEDILTDLSKIRGLRVASRNAVARYRGAPADLARVGAELGVKAVLEGSVRKAGNRVRISAQLIHAAGGFHLWADRYDRTLDDVFAVQEEIASAIAGALRVTLTPAEEAKLGQDRPNDARAYDLYLKGRALYGKYTRESLGEAQALFEQAIAIDPNYALAWAGVADCLGQMVAYAFTPDPSAALERGLEAARRAVDLNPRLPEAHKAEALIHGGMGDRAAADASLKRALDADPRFVPAIVNLGTSRFTACDVAGAERRMRQAIEIDPEMGFAMLWLAALTMDTGRGDEALYLARDLLEISQDPFYVTASHVLQAAVYLNRGDVASAERVLQEGLAAGARPKSIACVRAQIAAQTGRLDEAGRLLRELHAELGLGIGEIVSLAATAILLGEPETAARLFTRPLLKDSVQVLARLTPELHPLLDHPPLAPRKLDATLVWPLEAPMIDAARFALFREVKIESGRPLGSELTSA